MEHDESTGNVVCSCLHTTTFAILAQEFTPSINYLSTDAYLDLTLDNILDNPLGFIVVLSWIGVVTFIIIIAQYVLKINDKPLISHTHSVLKQSETNLFQLNKIRHRTIQEATILANKDTSGCGKICKLFILYLKNDHIIFGIFCRNYGTNYSTPRRGAVLIARVLQTLALSSLFYGRSKDTIIGDLSLAFYESAFGFVPMFLISQWIQHYRPKERQSQFQMDLNKSTAKLQMAVSDSENTGLGYVTRTADGGEKIKHATAGAGATTATPKGSIASSGSGETTGKTVELATKTRLDGRKLKKVKTRKLAETLANMNNAQPGGGAPKLETNLMKSVDMSGSGNGNGYGNSNGNSSALEYDSDMQQSMEKLQLIWELRKRLIKRRYRYPHWCRNFTTCLLILWILICATITTVYCVYFDVYRDFINNVDISSECPDAQIDISEQQWLSYNSYATHIFAFVLFC